MTRFDFCDDCAPLGREKVREAFCAGGCIGALLALVLMFVGIVCGGCAAAPARWAPPTAPEIVAMGAAETLVAVDVLQTLDMNRHPGRQFFEANPLLGAHPSSARIALTGAAGGIAAAGLFVALPPRARWLVPLLVGIGEGLAIAGNVQAGLTLCLWGCSP